MLKEHHSVFLKVSIAIDICLITLAFFMGYGLRSAINEFEPLSAVIWLLPVFMLIWISLFHYFGIYQSFRTIKIPKMIFIIIKSALYGFIIFNCAINILKVPYLSRIFVTSIFVFAALLTAAEKILRIAFFRFIRKKGYNYRNILIIGTGSRTRNVIETVTRHSEWGLRIVGLIDEDKDKIGSEVLGYRVIGGFDNFQEIINTEVVDDALFVVPRSWLSRIEELMRACETEGIKIHLAVDYFQLEFAKAKQTDFNGLPLLTFETTSDKLWQLLFKRVLDIILSVLALILLSPLFLIIALLIKITSRGSVFFKQTRCSLNGRKFSLYKFRTMVMDAEEKVSELSSRNEMNGPVFKMKNDPRLTAAGKFLRQASLDELPQLWNVLKGDMSIVGPRPPLPKEVKEYAPWHRRRLSMRPGITCLWQANGRNSITDFEKWVKLDLSYIDNWSLWLDLKIMLKTIPAVLTRAGAG